MGRKPVPTEIKTLLGNPGQRPINDAEPQPQRAKRTPSPPSWLAPLAKAEWRRVAPYLWRNKLLTEADITAFAVYCQNVATFIEASQQLAEDGPTIDNGKGQTVRNPAQASAASAANIIKVFCAEFGLTPSSRTRMRLPDTNDDDSLDVILGGATAT